MSREREEQELEQGQRPAGEPGGLPGSAGQKPEGAEAESTPDNPPPPPEPKGATHDPE